MIHVVTKENRTLYTNALEQMHRLRKVHFVDQRQWPGAIVRSGGEYDEYDDEEAIYLLALEANGQVACSMRLRPVRDGSVMQTVFPNLPDDQGLDMGRSDIWEISRYCSSGVVRGWRGAHRQTEMRLAALEAALAQSVRLMIGIVELDLLARLMDSSGWRVTTLGEPVPLAAGLAQAVSVEVSHEALVEMQETQGMACPMSLNASRLWSPLPPQEFEVLSRVKALPPPRRQMAIGLMRSFVQVEPELTGRDLEICVDRAVASLRSTAYALTAANKP